MNILRKQPKYCQGFVDRHGVSRWYYRRPGLPRVPLPGLPWSPEFMAAYEAAVKGKKLEVGSKKTLQGSVSALIASYYNTSDFTRLSESTKSTYRGILERFRDAHGDKRIAHLQSGNLKKLLSEKAATPAAANNMLRMIRFLMRHAIDLGWRDDDPTIGVRKVRNSTVGFKTWEEEHIDSFVAHHKQGTRAHLALMLLLYTGQRRSDVVRMGRQHIRADILSNKQQKTGQDVHIPLHSELRGALAALPLNNMTFLVTAQGKPFTPAGFTNWFRDMVTEAGLPAGLSPHGLRKATCRRLAESGCTPHEIMAISGHKSLAEVTRYTVAAGRKQLAMKAMNSLEKNEN